MANEANNPNEEERSPSPLDIGHPVHLFIDTSTFENLDFHFDGPELAALLARIESGDIHWLLPTITRREVDGRIGPVVHEAKVAQARLKKAVQALRRLPKHPLHRVDEKVEWTPIEAALRKAWVEFVETGQPTAIEPNATDVKGVFDDFFAHKAPFSGGDKKSEFPDAFVLRSLAAYAAKRGVKVVVVSRDGDFEAGCKAYHALIYFNSLPTVLGLSTQYTIQFRSLLDQHLPTLESDVLADFNNRGFFWESDEGHDSEVTDVTDDEVLSWDFSVVDVKNGWAEIAGEAEISFRAHASYPDPSMSYKDDETKEWMSFGNEYATLRASVDIPVSFQVRIASLQRGKLKYRNLLVNNGGDVWFKEEEIESIEHDDYSE